MCLSYGEKNVIIIYYSYYYKIYAGEILKEPHSNEPT